ncbi:GntR family transcriptional regulator [Bordetella hinzii]|nr:HTH-type transcriptional regulator LutR [Bordetella hinzii]KCB32790.1 FadR C-terminal domain protein [Bordetella hinzii L60]SNV83971.1 GntR family transcriptional regulator [Bordetella hinzii]
MVKFAFKNFERSTASPMSKTPFSMLPIKRTDIFQEVCQQLENLLNSGQLQVGDRLPSERELSESFLVSRSSIRQALKVFEAAGRIETRVGSGTFLVERKRDSGDAGSLNDMLSQGVNKELMQHLIAARTAVERAVFEAYAVKANKGGIRILKELIDENAQDKTASGEFEENAGLDLSFEAKVAELAGNPILCAMQRQVHQLWTQAWRMYGFVPESRQTLHQEHCAIIEALASKNTPRVIDLVVQHVDKEVL